MGDLKHPSIDRWGHTARAWLLSAGIDPEERMPVGLALGATRAESLALCLERVVLCEKPDRLKVGNTLCFGSACFTVYAINPDGSAVIVENPGEMS